MPLMVLTLACRGLGVCGGTAYLGAAEAGGGGDLAGSGELDDGAVPGSHDEHRGDRTTRNHLHHLRRARFLAGTHVGDHDDRDDTVTRSSAQCRGSESLERRIPVAGRGLQHVRPPVGGVLPHGEPRHATGPAAGRRRAALLLRHVLVS